MNPFLIGIGIFIAYFLYTRIIKLYLAVWFYYRQGVAF
jgi:hypothetical protein